MGEREATTHGEETDHRDEDQDDELTVPYLLDAIIIAAMLPALPAIVVLIFVAYLQDLLSVGTAIYAAFLVALLGFISLPIFVIRPIWVQYRYRPLLEREKRDLTIFRKLLSRPSGSDTAVPTSEARTRLNAAIETVDNLQVSNHPIHPVLQNDVAFLSNYYWANRQKVYALDALDRLGLDQPIEGPETNETTDNGFRGTMRRFRFSLALQRQVGKPDVSVRKASRLPTIAKWVRSSAGRALPEEHRKEIDGYLKGKSAGQKEETKDCCKKCCCCCEDEPDEDDGTESVNENGGTGEGSIDPYGLYMAVSVLQSWEVGQVSRMLSVRRHLQLLIYFGALLLVILVGLVGPSVDEFLIQTAIVATVAGMLGALFSLALPFGKREFTLTSESTETQPAIPPATIIVESILLRVVIGGIAGLFVVSFLGLSNWDWIFAPEVAALIEGPVGGRASPATLAFAFVGGFSERLVDSLIAQVEERFGVETDGEPEPAETPEASD